MTVNRYYTSLGVATTFQTSVNNSVTSFILNGPLTNWPTSYPFTVLCDWQSATVPEVCTITQAPTGAGPYTFANVIRGVDGSSGQAHAATSGQIVPGFSARDFAEPQAHMAATVAHGTTGNVADASLVAALASPALSGTPTAPTAAALTSNTQVATTAYVDSAVAVAGSRYKLLGAAAINASGYSAVSFGSVSIPANDAVALGKYQFTAYGAGIYGSGFLSFNSGIVSLGGTTVLTIPTTTFPCSNTVLINFRLVVTLIPVTIGASATWLCFIDVYSSGESGATAPLGQELFTFSSSATVTKDSTASQTFAITLTSSVSTTLYSYSGYLERLA